MEVLSVNIKVMVVQLVGFLLFMWVFVRYFYKPVMDFVEQHEREVEEEVEKLRREREEYSRAKEKHLREAERLRGLFEENKHILKAMREREIRNFRKDLEFQKKRELERLEEEYKSKLTAEIISLKVQLVDEIKEAIARSVENFLKEKLTREDSERLVDLFVEELWSGGEKIEKR